MKIQSFIFKQQLMAIVDGIVANDCVTPPRVERRPSSNGTKEQRGPPVEEVSDAQKVVCIPA